ncbi:hypothetical protein [Engelhardtia mirabilis]|uniref:Restriction endonuclease type IV Mrr domain-containing protein n=1 Tax=Engelhardtia mirabilis TaxID=2528011 RepID=A0A518BDQ0_9BACT|nr:hypothetical protein Pla133_01830 [Planctomycetes bacterium Pla133]QDU99445.1 hypothetical protein Pla86_01830 [Planctomycetes bacterium Pla86]
MQDHKATKRNEVEWVKDELVPLLHHLGFRRIDSIHGPLEAGRDIVVADHDRFGLAHHDCIQAKDGNLSARSETAELRSILFQLSTAYETPYRDPSAGTEHKIRTVYLIVNGGITDAAKNILYSKTGGWLRIVDKTQLEVAGYAGRVQTENNVSMAARAMWLEVSDNIDTWKGCSLETHAGAELVLPLYSLETSATKRLFEVACDVSHLADVLVLNHLRRAASSANSILGKIPLGPNANESVTNAVNTMRVAYETYSSIAEDVERIYEGISNSPFPLPGARYPKFSERPDPSEGAEENEC